MSILNGPAVAALFNPRSALVDDKGVPTTAYGRALLQALYARTGSGTGIVPSVSEQLTATGNTLATALALTDDWNIVTTVAAGSGVIISSALKLQPGNDIWVFNFGAHALNVYPTSGSVAIDALAAGSPYSLPSGARSRCFQCLSATQFSSYGN